MISTASSCYTREHVTKRSGRFNAGWPIHARRRYRGDIFVATADQATLDVYLEFFAMNRHGKQVGLVEVTL